VARAAELVEQGLESARELGISKEVERLLSLKIGQHQLADLDVQGSIMLVARSVERARPDLTDAVAPDGTVTIMFSDIEGSTVLTEQLGDQRWLELLHRHNALIRRHLAEHAGFEVKSQGDGFMVAFASARSAIQCAIAIQREVEARNEHTTNQRLRVRIGLHTGEVIREREDFFGKNVILAARIAAAAHGGEILVSALVRELVASTQEFDFGEPREERLKGLHDPHRLYEVQWAAADALAPAATAGSERFD
jgi:class 3 adenylate cyclase